MSDAKHAGRLGESPQATMPAGQATGHDTATDAPRAAETEAEAEADRHHHATDTPDPDASRNREAAAVSAGHDTAKGSPQTARHSATEAPGADAARSREAASTSAGHDTAKSSPQTARHSATDASGAGQDAGAQATHTTGAAHVTVHDGKGLTTGAGRDAPGMSLPTQPRRQGRDAPQPAPDLATLTARIEAARPDLPAAAIRALAEAEARRLTTPAPDLPVELGGRDGPEPVRYGDYERKGLCVDF